jgi:hypothetical protein
MGKKLTAEQSVADDLLKMLHSHDSKNSLIKHVHNWGIRANCQRYSGLKAGLTHVKKALIFLYFEVVGSN